MSLKVSDNTSISMPIRNMLAIIGAVAVGVWAYFGIVERLNLLENKSMLLEKDMDSAHERLHTEVKQNTEFRIKYPRGELGQSAQDIEQFMLIEDLYKSVDRILKELDEGRNNKVNIEFLKEQMEKALENIERLKDADREIVYKNGNGAH
jgi:methylthioribose-1-phosphate isomerase